ncbi:MAG TPA: ATP-binding protein [Tepidisphaeraceae bacterium]
MGSNGSNGETTPATGGRFESKRSAACDIADIDLPRRRDEAASLVRHALIEEPRHRATSVFLRTDEYGQVCQGYPQLAADLMLECLPRFLSRRGGQIVHAAQFGREGHGNVAEKHITIEGARHAILASGTLFMEAGGQRAVLTAGRDGFGGEWYCHLLLATDGDAAGLLSEWDEFARSDNYLRGHAFFADGTLIKPRKTLCWDDVVLPQATREMVVRQVQQFLANRQSLREMGMRISRGLILAGPSGTGKTLLCKVLAQQVEASFVWVTPRHVQNAGSFGDILEVCKLVTPAVLVLEDLDLFGEDRDATRSPVLGELMNQLDGAAEHEDIITIATTNRLDVVEKALRSRPGRFDRVIELLPPDEPGRRLLLARFLQGTAVADADLDWLAHVTYSYTGAHLRELANTALMLIASGRDGSAGTDRAVLEQALSELPVDRRRGVGFH